MNDTSLGMRIKHLRKSHKLTQVDLGRSIGVSGVTVGYWEKDLNEPKGKALSKLAKVLNTTENYLLYGVEDPAAQLMSIRQANEVPLFMIWDDALRYINSKGVPIMNNKTKTITSFVNVSIESFALRMSNDSMITSNGGGIPQGAIVVFDPKLKPTEGKIVLAQITEGDKKHLIIKKLMIDGSQQYLMPLNSQYQSTLVDEQCKFLAVACSVQYEI
ncbi:helix-turn-helix domain-containing protein [Xenorhabdus sp. 12]|uniref:Helix-turn-helix domain-containing protein n=1 Tax=Xenorhabdus santafensis TaxID=2582833 RepID=A0ABU4SAQ7_9GAMM|nr:S24 family peptidase [Xenorhabdus sp. 12]MDX7987836.1 helix-turn-helix domain-containing protein [Xenorhabdus sp. 12]